MHAIDTNILVYAFDTSYPRRRAVCKKIVEDIFLGKDEAVVTNQILAEFAVVVTKKIEHPLPAKKAQTIIGAIIASENWHVLDYSGSTVLKALGSKRHFWDALIAETLKEQGIRDILTKNEEDFKKSGIRPQSPF